MTPHQLAKIFSSMFERMTPADIKTIVATDALAWRQSMNGTAAGAIEARQVFIEAVQDAFSNMTQNDIDVLSTIVKGN